MTRAVVLSEHDLGTWSARYRAGEVAARLPYGVDALEEAGYTLTGAPSAHGRLATKVRDVVEHRTGLAVDRQLRAVPDVRRSDLVLALLERQGMLPALLKARRVPPYAGRPLVIWSCWLADDLRSADPATRRHLARRLRSVDLITHLSRHETEVFTELGIPEERLFAVTYGVSDRYYTPDPAVEQDIEVLAVGQDRGRDYATLFEAVRGTPLTLDVVCRAENVAHLDVPANVRVHGPVPLPAYRALLRRARTVAVPTYDLAYPTGSSVALEAASTGCCVVVSGTRAMRDYFVDDHDARLVDVGDVEGWRRTLLALRGEPGARARLGAAARGSVTGRFNAHHMWTELAQVMAERGVVPPQRRGADR